MDEVNKALAIATLGLTIALILLAGELFLQRRKRKETVTVENISDNELEQLNRLPAAVSVALLWMDPGENPAWHYKLQLHMRADFPAMAQALDRLVDEGSSKGEVK